MRRGWPNRLSPSVDVLGAFRSVSRPSQDEVCLVQRVQTREHDRDFRAAVAGCVRLNDGLLVGHVLIPGDAVGKDAGVDVGVASFSTNIQAWSSGVPPSASMPDKSMVSIPGWKSPMTSASARLSGVSKSLNTKVSAPSPTVIKSCPGPPTSTSSPSPPATTLAPGSPPPPASAEEFGTVPNAVSRATSTKVPLVPSAQHPRQIPAPRTAWIIHIVRNLLRAFGCQFIEPIDELGIAATPAKSR